MDEVLRGSVALRSGRLTRAALRWNYRALYPDVYAHKSVGPSLRRNAAGAALWSRGNGVITGRAAAALHGALWVDETVPIELIGGATRAPNGIIVRDERIDADEITEIAGLLVATPQRTAFDLARHLDRDAAVAHLDALAQATDVKAADVAALADRRRRARGLKRLRVALDLMDAGAQSPKETWLRLVLIDAGLGKPRTQIRVTDGFNEAFLDMGYDEPQVGLDYAGSRHFTDRRRYVRDIGRAELIANRNWIDILVVAQHTKRYIVHRVTAAFRRRGYRPAPARRV